MMTLVEQYVVSDLDEETCHIIIASYEQFRKDGFIGEEPIRIHARKFIEKYNIPPHGIAMWMEVLANECYRYFYRKTFGK